MRATNGPTTLRKPGFFSGARAFLQGLWTLVSSPSLWGLALVPVAIAFVMTGILGTLAVKIVPSLVASSVGSSGAWWTVALQVLLTFAAVIVAFFLALTLAQPLSGPALEALVRRVEKDLGAPVRPQTPFLTDIGRSLASALLGLGFGLPFLFLAFLLNFVPGGSFVAVPLKFLIAMVVVAWDLCDYPLSVRGTPLGERIRFIAHHIGPVLGFSLGAALVALLPCGALLLLPAGVCGATRLLHDLERYDRTAPR